MKLKKLAILFLSVSMTASVVTSVHADTTREQIESVEAQKASTQSSLNAAQARIDQLSGLKGNREAYLSELNAQYEELTRELEELTNKARKKELELKEVKADLKAAKRQEAGQYAAMKMRIAYMYENGETSALTAILSAGSFSDFLNRAENAAQISAYDRKMLEEYQETRKEVAKQKAKVEKEQQEIEKLKKAREEKRVEVEQLEASTQEEIASYQAQINDEQSEASSLLALINSQTAKLENLLAKAQAEEEAAAKAQAEAEARVRRAQEEEQRAQEAAAQEEESQTEESQEPESSYEEEPEYSEETQQEQQEEEESYDSSSDESAETDSSSQESSSSGTYLGNFKLTAYCNCAQCCGVAGNLTASGTVPTAGRTVAMAGLPFGTQLMINGSVYTVEDLGTPYGHLDIFMNSHSDALNFGLQYADVYQLN